jgi:hypothetical protein
MKSRFLASLFVILLVLTGAAPAAGEEPTPTPRPKVKRKLGGGSFGQPPATTPTPAPKGTGSLADVVRKTQDELAPPSQRKSRGIVITNETLRKPERADGPSASISIIGSAGAKPSIKTPPTPAPGTDLVPEYKDATGKTESEWRARASDVRSRAEETEASVTAAQAEVRRLENDFYAWSDGNYRERVIRPAWDQAKENLKRLESELENARGELVSLEDEARKSGTPPGWLR